MKLQKRPTMMNKMKWLEVTLNEKLVQTVSARDLWRWVESKREFAHWIKFRIEEGRFVKDRDYVVIKNMVKNQQTTTQIGDPIEYFVTVEMGKHLAMMERNEKGFQAREYFIKCEAHLWKLLEKDRDIERTSTLPMTSLGFQQLTLKERKKQRNHFHQIFKGFHLTRGKRSHHRIKMCHAVNLIINGISSYQFRRRTGITGMTRDWLPVANQFALYRTEYDLLEVCVRNDFQLSFEDLESHYSNLASANKRIAEITFGVDLHDTLLVYVQNVVSNVRLQLQDDKISPYQFTEAQVLRMMEERALLLDELSSHTVSEAVA